ncbi:hypothetical protein FJY63_01290, partial [Candidatus Sumerlaeota bacterium]|nr:hypothetical protein [Candidatus Sumerlaeota bacterium]
MRRIDRTNLAIFSVIILFAAAALGLLLWLRGRFERERTETIATVKRLFSPATLGLPDSIQALTFAKVEQLNETFIPRSGYVRAIVVTKQVAGRGERVVLPWYFQIAHGSDWRDRLRQLDRHSLVNSGVEYGAIYFDYDNSRLNSVRAAVGSLAVLLVFVLALVGRRLWVQEVALTRTTIELEEKRRELV